MNFDEFIYSILNFSEKTFKHALVKTLSIVQPNIVACGLVEAGRSS